MSINQRETLEDRLDKRRRLRNKIFLDKNSVDESEITLINHSPTTQSLDRKSSKRITPISSLTPPAISTSSANQHNRSATITENSELPTIENSYHPLSNNKITSTPRQSQVTKHQSLESEKDKQALTKSFSINDQQQIYSHNDEKPVIIKETVSPRTIIESSHSYHDEKPVIIKETVTSTLPPIIPSTTTEKFNPIQENAHLHQNEKLVILKETVTPILPSRTTEKSTSISRETRGNSTPYQMKNFSQNLDLDHPSSNPQSTSQQKQFDYPPFHRKSIVRTTSEQILSTTERKNQPIRPIFAKQNSLAILYLFSKRMVDTELARASSPDSEKSQRKTIWD